MSERLFLLDTNVVSEMARPRPDPGVLAFLGETAKFSISVMVLHELEFGCEALTDAERRAQVSRFVGDVRQRFGSTALPIDLDIASKAARLRAFAKRNGRVLALADALIATTALVHGRTLVTRNVKDFAGLDVALLNPFQSA